MVSSVYVHEIFDLFLLHSPGKKPCFGISKRFKDIVVTV